ncbi:MAG TPA: hypothetical protein VG734_26520 [Lacunisphaera sp.]|nr:hypothetical protein [Lacunisphaera sp.]
MNLTWHIVKKDLRVFRWPLLAWVLLIVAKLGVGVILLTADGTESEIWFKSMAGFAQLLAALEGASFVLTAALVQEDLLVGTRAFWRTRPISGARLLHAKLITLGLVFGLVPLLVTLPWWLGCGFGWREIGWAALQTAGLHLAGVLLGLLCAIVTDGFGRFLMWTLVAVFAVPALAATLAYHVGGKVSPGGDLATTRFALMGAVGAIAIGAVTIHQYLTLRTVRSIGIIAGAVAVLALIGAFWPFAWKFQAGPYTEVMAKEAERWSPANAPAGFGFNVQSVQLRMERPAFKDGHLILKLRVDGLADSQALSFFLSDYTLRWPDGWTKKGGMWGRTGLLDRSVEKALGVAMKFAPERRYSDEVTTSAWLAPEVVHRLTDYPPPAFELNGRFQLLRFDSAIPVALPDKARTWNGVAGERVAWTRKTGEYLLVTFVRNAPALWRYDFADSYFAQKQFTQHLLANRALGFVDNGRSAGHRSAKIGTVEIIWHTQSYRASPMAGGPRPLPEAIAALNEAELMRITFVEEARFTHPIKIDPLVVEPASP